MRPERKITSCGEESGVQSKSGDPYSVSRGAWRDRVLECWVLARDTTCLQLITTVHACTRRPGLLSSSSRDKATYHTIKTPENRQSFRYGKMQSRQIGHSRRGVCQYGRCRCLRMRQEFHRYFRGYLMACNSFHLVSQVIWYCHDVRILTEPFVSRQGHEQSLLLLTNPT